MHIPIILPILDALKQCPEIDLAIGYMPYNPQINRGFTPDEIEKLRAYGLPLYPVPQDFQPDITIVADSDYKQVTNCGTIIHIGHGVLSKGHFYTDTPLGRREEIADIICVPGKYHKEAMKKFISKPVIATGMPKLDELFAGKITREIELQKRNLPLDAYYVLFAPTFNDELSAIPFTRENITQVLPTQESILLIKLHGLTAQHYKDMYKYLSLIHKNVIYIEEQDISPFMAIADVMISDVSSAMMEFAALQKPVVLFNNPYQKTFKHYNPTDLEYTHREIGYQVNSLDEIKIAIQKYHSGQDPFIESRKNITDQVFENKYDGAATQRIVDIVRKLTTR